MSKSNHNQQDRMYEYWRMRILYSTMLGYIFFYFIRKNLSMAMPGINAMGVGEVQLGIFITAHGLLYGLSRFINGILADRANPRYFMVAGLLVCAVANICFSLGNAPIWMGVFWMINGWFQGMGYPPCSKSLTHWFAAEERGVKFSIWNTSHSLGAGLIFLLNGFLIWYFEDWRFCLFVPGFIGLFGCYILWDRLRDSPESMGMLPVEEYYRKKQRVQSQENVVDSITPSDFSNHRKTEQNIEHDIAELMEPEPWGRLLVKHVFSNPAVWIISFANFFVYIVRFSILDWAPTFLLKAKGIEVSKSSIICSAYELIGVLGMLCGGYLMDRVFRGRGAKVCCLYMLGCTITMGLFWWMNSNSFWLNVVFLAILGFFIYGPQCLIGVIAANVATKKAASAANGLAGIMGYLSVIVTGWGVAQLSKSQYGWNGVFFCLIGSSFIAMVLFLFVLDAASPEQKAAEKWEQEKGE